LPKYVGKKDRSIDWGGLASSWLANNKAQQEEKRERARQFVQAAIKQAEFGSGDREQRIAELQRIAQANPEPFQLAGFDASTMSFKATPEEEASRAKASTEKTIAEGKRATFDPNNPDKAAPYLKHLLITDTKMNGDVQGVDYAKGFLPEDEWTKGVGATLTNTQVTADQADRSRQSGENAKTAASASITRARITQEGANKRNQDNNAARAERERVNFEKALALRLSPEDRDTLKSANSLIAAAEKTIREAEPKLQTAQAAGKPSIWGGKSKGPDPRVITQVEQQRIDNARAIIARENARKADVFNRNGSLIDSVMQSLGGGQEPVESPRDGGDSDVDAAIARANEQLEGLRRRLREDEGVQ
jgi:hypothetical protein